ncbi:MAG: hypothetical protein J6T43_00005, partial [Prevotella sp.]|nr:hypothetical protein [Prevotella sp.]
IHFDNNTIFFSKKNYIIFSSSFLWRQRKEAKETSTYPHPLPIWRGSTAPTRRSFIKVSSPHQRGGLLFLSAYARLYIHPTFSVFPFISVSSVMEKY